ncbi:O-antigen ligase family protein [Paludibacterium yongneupense]|uniref:O-antigen ligase family protein n=1 Tax=Paludibacterium yongneupense TaxID=400061 RepID=UPI0004184079|nr:O-antigen ligase family protein [Paludibacterium yongneupense]
MTTEIRVQNISSIKFSDWFFYIVLFLKPAADAFYEVGSIRYLYMVLLFGTAAIAFTGKKLAGGAMHFDGRNWLQVALFSLAYFSFLLIMSVIYGGSWDGMFKIISPFILFLLISAAADENLIYVLGWSSVGTIIGNAMLLPFSYGWVYWGTVHTFKGFYYFKTDLAYALTFSALFVAMMDKFKLTPLVMFCFGLASIQIVLSNSRMNYLTFSVLTLFLLTRSGLSVMSIVRILLLLTFIGGVAATLYDPTRLLSFDASNLNSFTQGRDHIWSVMFYQGLMKYTPLQWMFGKGMFADSLIYARNVFSAEAHNAHNEWLHMLTTQGVMGQIAYLALWWMVARACRRSDTPGWCRRVLGLAMLLAFLQSFTIQISLFSTKTWPLMCVFLAVAMVKAEKPGVGAREK